MIHIIWEFQVELPQIVAFEKAYSSQGAWAVLFQQSKEYHGTTLLKDSTTTSRYFTIDCWSDLDAFNSFKTKFAKAYQELDYACEKITLTERQIGIFEKI